MEMELTRGTEKKMREWERGMKEMESKEAVKKTAKRMKNEASDHFRDWLQLVVMIGAGRGGELCLCTGRRPVRVALRGNSSPSCL